MSARPHTRIFVALYMAQLDEVFRGQALDGLDANGRVAVFQRVEKRSRNPIVWRSVTWDEIYTIGCPRRLAEKILLRTLRADSETMRVGLVYDEATSQNLPKDYLSHAFVTVLDADMCPAVANWV